MEFDSTSEAKAKHEEEVIESRKFTCGVCDITWHATGYTSNCWVCDKEYVILTLNDY